MSMTPGVRAVHAVAQHCLPAAADSLQPGDDAELCNPAIPAVGQPIRIGDDREGPLLPQSSPPRILDDENHQRCSR